MKRIEEGSSRLVVTRGDRAVDLEMAEQDAGAASEGHVYRGLAPSAAAAS
jgi:hypothetical protein